MVSDICGICPLTQCWYKLLNVALLHKDNLFWQLHSQHPSTDLLHFWIHKLPTNHVIGIRIAWAYLIPSETNLFKLFCVPSAWTSSGCTGSRTQKRSIQWKQHWCYIDNLQFIDLWVSTKSRSTIPVAMLLTEGCFSISDQLIDFWVSPKSLLVILAAMLLTEGFFSITD